MEQIIKYVEIYGKTRSAHGISREVKEEIIKLHDEIIPMDIKLYKPTSPDCGSCLNKALARLFMHFDILLQYAEDRKPKVKDTPTKPKNKGGRPRKKK